MRSAIRVKRIVLVTDFGADLYVGQVVARLNDGVPELPIIDLVHDLPPFRPDLAAYLLPALVRDMPRGTLYLCVVDPGVGSNRRGLVLEAGGDLFVGPDNGLLSRVARRSPGARARWVDWQPPDQSPSFQGRDWFARVAVALCRGEPPALRQIAIGRLSGADWPDALPTVIYVDTYGNLMCGLQAACFPVDARIQVAERSLRRVRTFCEALPGEPFWYENALGLVELAVNQGRADRVLGLAPGDLVTPLEAVSADSTG